MTTPTGNGHALPRLPRRGEQIRDAERLGAQMLAVLQRTCDPASDPSAEDDPHGLGYVHIRRLSAIADVRSALLMLSQITDLDLPPAGSAVRLRACRYPECECESDYPCGDKAAVHVPGPPLPDALDEGDGPPSHRTPPGEGADARPVQDAAVPGVPLGEARSDSAESQRAGDSFSLPVPPDWHWLNTK